MNHWLTVARRWLLSWQLAMACRLALGILFIIAGWSKIGQPTEMVQTVLRYNILPGLIVRPFAVALPWVEVLSGGLLIVGLLLPSASAMLAVLNASFVVAIGINLWRGVNIDCGCFGAGEPLSWDLFFRDIGLLLMSVQVLFAEKGFLSLEAALQSLRRNREQH